MATLFKQHRETKYFRISRSWWFEAMPMNCLTAFVDTVQLALQARLGFPEPDHKIYLAIGHKEGKHIQQNGYTIRVPNCLAGMLCWHIYRAALVRVKATMPLREDGKRFSQESLQGELEFQIQQYMPKEMVWLWFGSHRKDRKEIDLSYEGKGIRGGYIYEGINPCIITK
jgi:hypothetical protein